VRTFQQKVDATSDGLLERRPKVWPDSPHP
jgi:hypothetical protein